MTKIYSFFSIFCIFSSLSSCKKNVNCCLSPTYLFKLPAMVNSNDTFFPATNLDTSSYPKILLGMPYPEPLGDNGYEWFSKIDFSTYSVVHVWFGKNREFFNLYNFEVQLDTSLKLLTFKLTYINKCDGYCTNSNFTLPVKGSVYIQIPRVDSSYSINYTQNIH